MTSRDFVYWLQGFLEINGEPTVLSIKQVQIIQNHLNMVFKHEIDPSFGDEKAQTELSEIHTGTSTWRPRDDMRIKC